MRGARHAAARASFYVVGFGRVAVCASVGVVEFGRVAVCARALRL
ncbi:MAG: hypothetical protein RLZZ153_780, partial [Pseudomonadota bacterium]